MKRPASALAGGLLLLFACARSPTPRADDPSPPSSPVPAPSPSIPELPPCEYPEKLEMPGWVPEDLPLPKGTYAMRRLTPLAGYRRALLVVPTTLEPMTRLILREWPRKGWVLGRGDSEPGEIEDQFTRGPAVGAFKAQSVYCVPGYSLMYLIFAPKRPPVPGPALTPSPQGTALVPGGAG